MKYFIDTSVIINLLSNKENTKFTELLKDDENRLFINRLVLSESLRTIKLQDTRIYKNAKESLELFEQINITPDIYNKTIEFSRFFKSKGQALKGRCELIDILHFISAKHYNLEIITNDTDFDKLEEQYKEYNNP